MTEPIVRPMPGGVVRVEVDPDENLLPAHTVYLLGTEMVEAALTSQAIRLVDDVMDRHRRRFAHIQAEWQLLDEVWRDLRLALGYDDRPHLP